MRRIIKLNKETIRTMAGRELNQVKGGFVDESIIYRCATNTSDARSCFSDCTSNTTF